MTHSLVLPLARSAVDRSYLRRKDEFWISELLQKSTTRVLPIFDGKVLLREAVGETQAALRLFAPELLDGAELHVYLGCSTEEVFDEPVGTELLLAVLSQTSARRLEPDETKWHTLRRNGAGLADRDAGIYAQALSIANWHAAHPRCSQCGQETEVIESGWVRRCSNDNKDFYPRTDPAIIAAIVDDQQRLLMGSQGIWEDNRWSVLAGFVEPGESLTAAVEREIFEESGLRVSNIEFLGSQAWPFPYSLMVGFTAQAIGQQQLQPDGLEIEKLRWFSRDELAENVATLLLPSRLSIARALIENWFGGELISATELAESNK